MISIVFSDFCKFWDSLEPPYMAPELYDITNNVVTDKSDMYSLGVLLWEMLSGLVPWQGCDPLVVAYAVTINQDRLPLSNIPPERLPHKLQRLMERLWDHDPLRRPAAAEVVKQLALIQQDVARQEGRQLVAASVQPQLQIHLDPQPQCEVPAQQPRQQQPQPQVDAEAAS
ncbi:hypothetical protein VOLCADRAFT_87539 [Volvox carteri f. nagariensis]|uniref:Protein kinase domain-containing protein n=1 Tax=Volvox carteri f. nagariensis TaxID=3068 RepID=D8TLK3_VOLCA|nr:uncharacterized protein VOLCADRAFT_87539 [Volvox carteri f. nagariensis]EFJ51888.1 hypothetical protein VOLCADRAFT_87539 [Volvox carteri f. nagariensis]|eukprot:XP_002947298.1 hypothetical protein VOLCADRAFT_87539 [Volvox carteri f. nagariensis]